MDATQFERAKVLVPSLATADVTVFKAGLLQDNFTWGASAAIEWWTCDFKQRGDLQKLVAAGAKQADCKTLLSRLCNALSVGDCKAAIGQFTTGEFNRSGWLQYFFNEAAGAVGSKPHTDPDRRLVVDIGNSFFFKNGGDIEQKYAYDTVDAKVFKQLLYVLLTIGFDRVPATKEHILAGDSSNALIMSHMLWAGNDDEDAPKSPGGIAIKRIPIRYKWRCDSRQYSDVVAANGFVTKSNSEGYARLKSLREDWHPFSDEGPRSYMWFRKGQTDNCLYNVVSVGTGDWQGFVVYPKIDLSGGAVNKLSGYLGTRKVNCKSVKTSTVVQLDLPVSETYLYLFLQIGPVFDTGAAQGSNAYPEVGMASIPLKNIFGALRFVRYHLGPEASVKDDAGMIVFCDKSKTHENSDDAHSIRASCGREVYGATAIQFETVKNAPPLQVKWAATGYTKQPANTPFDFNGDKYIVLLPLTA
ncbi:hypothetical protein [Luteimonas deserti]|uniref:Uncharacterized protein n=1 Tax=Luteimonas deserti TaxID=2752306 RepID=A0A7Z0QT39_9GAMM|nr:hypothetical protein [Luteimonas deserti]NYZ64288.1 hypothetical protein [Luteimonas deserti]